MTETIRRDSSPQHEQSGNWVAVTAPGHLRLTVSLVIVMVILALSVSLWLPVWRGTTVGPALWGAQGILVVGALGLWRRLRLSARPHRFSLRGGCWRVQRCRAGDWTMLGSDSGARAPVILPGLVILPGGRDWVFSDECKSDDWRRLNLCARFARK